MKIFVVMPVINLWNFYTKPAIESVNEAMMRAKAHNIDCRFLLIDNASTDETKTEANQMISELFEYKRNEERWGFQRSVNFGINNGFKNGCDVALVLNNDIILHPEAIWRIAERMEKGDACLVSCMDVHGEMFDKKIAPQDIGTLISKEYESMEEVPHPCFSAFAINKECWESIGEFDELFAPAYFEDNDYHYRMKLIGLLAVLYPPAMFYHFGSRTQTNGDENGRTIVSTPMFENNRAFYVKKWGGVPGEEKWEHPYNDLLVPITRVKQTPMTTWDDVEKEVDQIEIQYSMDKPIEKKIFELVSELESGIYLEIGTAYGRTLHTAARAAQGRDIQCYGIDNLSLIRPGGEALIRKSIEGLPATLLIGKSESVPWDKPIDILVIDGCHISYVVRRDYDRFLPFLKSGGYVIMDDWCDTGIDTDVNPKNAHWGIAYYGKQATEGWKEIEIPDSRAKCFQKP